MNEPDYQRLEERVARLEAAVAQLVLRSSRSQNASPDAYPTLDPYQMARQTNVEKRVKR